jgi:hypothetical protein
VGRLFALLTLLILAGCASNQYVKAYEGADLPATQLALLKPTSGVVIHSIDGDRSKYMKTVGAFTEMEYEIALIPGHHVLVVSYDIGTFRSPTSVELDFQAEANHRYLVRTDVSGYFTGPKWSPKISDVSGEEKCWTAKVGTTFFSPNGC